MNKGHSIDEQEQVATSVGLDSFSSLKFRLANDLIMALTSRNLQTVVDFKANLMPKMGRVIGIVASDADSLAIDEPVECDRAFLFFYLIHHLTHLCLGQRLIVQTIYSTII